MDKNMNNNKQTYSVSEVAKMVGKSRVAVFKKIKNGQIRAEKVGRVYAIPREELSEILGVILSKNQKTLIEKAVEKTVADYGRTLELLGKE
jgi:excisionase family DNA binding protein